MDDNWSVYTSDSVLGRASWFSKLLFVWTFKFVKRAKKKD